MVVIATACLVGLVAVAVASLRDEPVTSRFGPPDWDPLPPPVEVARVRFPLAFPGYDPAAVEVTIEAINEAYATLLAVAPPEVVERARRRAAVRSGGEPAAPAPLGARAREDGHLADTVDDREALRAEAALAAVAGPALQR